MLKIIQLFPVLIISILVAGCAGIQKPTPLVPQFDKNKTLEAKQADYLVYQLKYENNILKQGLQNFSAEELKIVILRSSSNIIFNYNIGLNYIFAGQITETCLSLGSIFFASYLVSTIYNKSNDPSGILVYFGFLIGGGIISRIGGWLVSMPGDRYITQSIADYNFYLKNEMGLIEPDLSGYKSNNDFQLFNMKLFSMNF